MLIYRKTRIKSPPKKVVHRTQRSLSPGTFEKNQTLPEIVAPRRSLTWLFCTVSVAYLPHYLDNRSAIARFSGATEEVEKLLALSCQFCAIRCSFIQNYRTGGVSAQLQEFCRLSSALLLTPNVGVCVTPCAVSAVVPF